MPLELRCTCRSMKPGITNMLRRSITAVSGGSPSALGLDEAGSDLSDLAVGDDHSGVRHRLPAGNGEQLSGMNDGIGAAGAAACAARACQQGGSRCPE